MITNWNGIEFLSNTIQSVIQNTDENVTQIILVDDCSNDGSAEMVATDFPSVHLIKNTSNVGFAKSNNIGARYATGQFILLLNSDTVVLPNSVQYMIDYLNNHNDTAAAGAWLRSPDSTDQVSFGSFPSLLQALVDALFLNDLFPSAGLPNRGRFPLPAMKAPIEVDYVTGAALMLRRNVVDQIGLFDERFIAYCEETDLCYRITRELHQKVIFLPDAKIIHLGGASYGRMPKYKIQLTCSSNHKFLCKHKGQMYSLLTRLLYSWHFAAKSVFRMLACTVSPREMKQQKRNYARVAILSAWYYLFPPAHVDR